jgi:sulfate/thiosulfate transport system ATP-binding protein
VFHEPASAWVMRFLGDVNEFPVSSPRGSTVGYVRPHEIELSRSLTDVASLAARVRRVQPAGASVRVEFEADAASAPLVAELDERRFQELALRAGDDVFLSPRRVRVFEGHA